MKIHYNDENHFSMPIHFVNQKFYFLIYRICSLSLLYYDKSAQTHKDKLPLRFHPKYQNNSDVLKDPFKKEEKNSMLQHFMIRYFPKEKPQTEANESSKKPLN